MDSSSNNTRHRKKGGDDGKDSQDKQAASSSAQDEEPGGNKLPNLYSRFVESFESALSSVTDARVCSPRILPTLSIEGVSQYIKEKQPSNIIVMTGAGISTSAGVPDFRSPGSGLYDNLQKYKLKDPQDIFTIDFFKKTPEPFFQLAKELFPEDIKPTASHYFVKLLHQKGLLRRWYTQNIDSLEHLTGISEDKLVAAHGDHHSSTCLKCKAKYDLQWITNKLRDKDTLVPHCEKTDCDGVVKPDIVFFGENLPKRFFECAIQDFPSCDLLIIMGTSLIVQPFASMVDEVGSECPRLLINREAAGQAGPLQKMMGIGGLCYGRDGNKRDVYWKGTCDDGVRHLAALLNWDEELDALIEKGPVPLKKVPIT